MTSNERTGDILSAYLVLLTDGIHTIAWDSGEFYVKIDYKLLSPRSIHDDTWFHVYPSVIDELEHDRGKNNRQ